jgi:L-threonylcarbamoyladenylate synthase
VKEKKPETFAAAVEALRRGEVIVYPTETFYGLGGDALNRYAVERVAALKRRSLDSPIAVIIADRRMLSHIVGEVSPAAEKLIERFWPGPLTLILPAKKGLPAPLLNREGKIGVRISSHPIAARLARELGRPLTATSANPTGKEAARTIQQARNYFAGSVEIFLDGGSSMGKSGSTVVEIIRNELKIIREGEISAKELAQWI